MLHELACQPGVVAIHLLVRAGAAQQSRARALYASVGRVAWVGQGAARRGRRCAIGSRLVWRRGLGRLARGRLRDRRHRSRAVQFSPGAGGGVRWNERSGFFGRGSGCCPCHDAALYGNGAVRQRLVWRMRTAHIYQPHILLIYQTIADMTYQAHISVIYA